MIRMTRLLSAFAVTAALMAAACAPVTVRSFTARGTDFRAYRTFAWADDPPRSTGDPRLDGNPFFEDRLRLAAERQLAARGFEKVSSGESDLTLHYHASVAQRIDAGTIDARYGRCESCAGPSMYDAGTILLDLVDRRTNTLVWRGWAEGSLDGVIDDQRWMETRIDDSVARIVATLPRRL